MAHVTPNKIVEAQRMRGDGFSWDQIAKRLAVSPYVLRCAVEPGYREYKRENARREWAGREPRDPARPGGGRRRRLAKKVLPAPKRQPMRKDNHHRVTTAFEYIPLAVQLECERRKAALKRRTLTQILLGDPPEGWSALDQRGRG
jgi:hypothetical protein